MRNIKIVEKELNMAERNWFKSTYPDESKEAKLLEDNLRKLTEEYYSIVNQKNHDRLINAK